MKIRLLMAMNLDGKDYRAGDEIQIDARDGQALVRNKYAVAVVERAVQRPSAEIRD